MVKAGDRPGLALEPLIALAIRGEVRREYLDRDRAIEPRVAGFVDFTHAARADERLNLKHTEPVATLHDPARCCGGRVVCLERESAQQFDRGALRKAARVLVCRQQRLDFRLQRQIPAAQLAQTCRPLVRRPVQGLLKHLLDAIPARGVH
jgi:hypothetical protein